MYQCFDKKISDVKSIHFARWQCSLSTTQVSNMAPTNDFISWKTTIHFKLMIQVNKSIYEEAKTHNIQFNTRTKFLNFSIKVLPVTLDNHFFPRNRGFCIAKTKLVVFTPQNEHFEA